MSSVGLLPYIQFIRLCFLFLDIIFIYFSHLSFSQSRVGVRTECSSSECWFIYSANIIRIQLFIVHAIICVWAGYFWCCYNTILNYCLFYVLLFHFRYWWMIGCHDVQIWLIRWWIIGSVWCQWNQKMAAVPLFFSAVFIRWCRVKSKVLSNEALTISSMLLLSTRYAYGPSAVLAKVLLSHFNFPHFFIKKSNLTFSNAPWFFFVSPPWEKNGEICHLLTV